jgi:hypothetical protein
MLIGTTRLGWLGLMLGLLLMAAGCAGNEYGYGREYVPTDDEEEYLERAVEVSYEEVRRDPKSFESRLVGWFGVVTGARRGAQGGVLVALELRFHQQRHLCSDEFESSCKVTISERAGGPFSVELQLRSEDLSGSTRLNVGSLVKVYGTPTGEFDDRGGPLLKSLYYRHWPHGAFVTTTGAVNMRR